jgi:apolipoprotein N-acyltransferase
VLLFTNVVIYQLVEKIFIFKISWTRALNSLKIKIFAMLLIIALFYGYGFYVISKENYKGDKLRVALIQGNILEDYREPDHVEKVIKTYINLTSKVKNYDLIIWPETAIPRLFDHYIEEFPIEIDFSSFLFTGVPTATNYNDKIYNAAFLIAKDKKIIGRYAKTHLVPFGEFVPFEEYLPRWLVEQAGRFTQGENFEPINLGKFKFGVLICYEAIFPEISRNFAKKNADFLINITNDSWFGQTSALYQHIEMTAFRAIENRIPILRAANTGISATIDKFGRLRKKTDTFKEGILTDEIYLGNEKTFYTKYPDLFIYLLVISFIGIIIIKRKHGAL